MSALVLAGFGGQGARVTYIGEKVASIDISLNLKAKRKDEEMTEEVEIAEQKVNAAIDELWNSLDQMSINEAAMIFQRVRKKIDENIRELGH